MQLSGLPIPFITKTKETLMGLNRKSQGSNPCRPWVEKHYEHNEEVVEFYKSLFHFPEEYVCVCVHGCV